MVCSAVRIGDLTKLIPTCLGIERLFSLEVREHRLKEVVEVILTSFYRGMNQSLGYKKGDSSL